MRLSLRILVAFAVTFACAVGLAQIALGAVVSHAPLALQLSVPPLMLWVISFTGLKHGLVWARRPRIEDRQPILGGASRATHA